MDLRHLAVILDTGHRYAQKWAGPQDAALVQALAAGQVILAAMNEETA